MGSRAFFFAAEKTFPGKLRGTADPSASLGMTKRRGLLQRKDGR
jgi:hypothetical protein